MFWFASVAGAATVIVYAMSTGGGSFVPADFALIGAIGCAAVGNSEGGLLSRELGGWQVICWSVIVAAVFALLPVSVLLFGTTITLTGSAMAGLAYLCFFSALVGFFAWYHALAVGGVAKISQLQLFQPFFTVAFCSVFMDETITTPAVAAVICVSICVFIGFRTRLKAKPEKA
jgi:drug/metabolite transporter (DMT)-like permease